MKTMTTLLLFCALALMAGSSSASFSVCNKRPSPAWVAFSSFISSTKQINRECSVETVANGSACSFNAWRATVNTAMRGDSSFYDALVDVDTDHTIGDDADASVPDTADLWYIEDRTDVVEWLTQHNWEASAVESIELMTRYGRWTPDQADAVAPRTVFVEGHLVC